MYFAPIHGLISPAIFSILTLCPPDDDDDGEWKQCGGGGDVVVDDAADDGDDDDDGDVDWKQCGGGGDGGVRGRSEPGSQVMEAPRPFSMESSPTHLTFCLPVHSCKDQGLFLWTRRLVSLQTPISGLNCGGKKGHIWLRSFGAQAVCRGKFQCRNGVLRTKVRSAMCTSVLL